MLTVEGDGCPHRAFRRYHLSFFFLTKEAVWCGSALISVFRLFLIFRAPNGTENDKFPDLYRTASEWSG